MENLSVNVENLRRGSYKSKIMSKEEENYYPNELTMKVIAEAERGENMFGPYDTVEEVMEALDAED